jgi:hypothetical protein
MPGASWVLLDSAGAATCSAASLFIPVGWESPNPQDAVTELGVSTIQIYAADAAAKVAWCNGRYTSPVIHR